MPIPDFETIMLPLLRFVEDGREYSTGQAYAPLAEHFALTEAEKRQLQPSGAMPVFNNRVLWAKHYLAKAGLLEIPKRSMFKITKRGVEVLKSPPSKIDNTFLGQFPEFQEFRRKKINAESPKIETDQPSGKVPEELLNEAFQQIRRKLEDEVLDRVKTGSPAFFERLVVELLVKMGYGGSIEDAGKVIGGSGDAGIDGLIKEDRLGLDVIYLQAKRWDGVVGRPEIQKFAGALQGKRAKKGVFITTSTFSKEALDFVSNIDSKIVLIDGELLAELMIDHDLGVSKVISYDLKRLDSDYFSDE